MNHQNENKGGLIATEKGAVWKVKVGVHTVAEETAQIGRRKTKRWEIKIILN